MPSLQVVGTANCHLSPSLAILSSWVLQDIHSTARLPPRTLIVPLLPFPFQVKGVGTPGRHSTMPVLAPNCDTQTML